MIAIGFLLGVYFIVLIVLVIGWLKVEQQVMPLSQVNASVSIIVPFRNEEHSLPRLLPSLAGQKYSGKSEVIFVDDHSDDSSVQVVLDFIKRNDLSHFKLIRSKLPGKKRALTKAINVAEGEIILTTDADCSMSELWLQSMADRFSNSKVNMVVGPVRIESQRSFWSKMQQLEFASLIATTGSTLAFGNPTMCNGANLAFRKEVFAQVDGYSNNLEIPSGDDEFLMRKIKAVSRQGIVFNSNQDSIVSTKALPSIQAFLHQRIRWAGKWKSNSDFSTKLLAVTILTFHSAFLALAVIWAMNPLSYVLPLALLATKVFAEFILLYRVSCWLNNKWTWGSFFAWQLLYPFYSLYIGIASLKSGYKWKDRDYPAFAGS